MSSQGQDLIRQTLDEYRSTCFPQGILVVADNFSMKAKKQKIIITLILPFPCKSEFSELTQALSELLKCEVIFELSFNVMGVRQHQINGIKNIIAVASMMKHLKSLWSLCARNKNNYYSIHPTIKTISTLMFIKLF